jgi:hypothetical protein
MERCRNFRARRTRKAGHPRSRSYRAAGRRPRTAPAPCRTRPAAGMSRVDPTVKAVLPVGSTRLRVASSVTKGPRQGTEEPRIRMFQKRDQSKTCGGSELLAGASAPCASTSSASGARGFGKGSAGGRCFGVAAGRRSRCHNTARQLLQIWTSSSQIDTGAAPHTLQKPSRVSIGAAGACRWVHSSL